MKKIFIAVYFCAAAALGSAADLSALVVDKAGKPVADAVVFASALAPSPASTKQPIKSNRDSKIVQVDKEFVPYVTAIETGTLVDFPNDDKVKHHVYSFSPAKNFDLPLYSGSAAPSVRFDKPGVVVIGCNIHDWMIGYIYVADTPYFAKTDAHGKAMLKDLPAGKYTLRVWHPDSTDSEEKTLQQADINGNLELSWRIAIKPRINPRHSTVHDMNAY